MFVKLLQKHSIHSCDKSYNEVNKAENVCQWGSADKFFFFTMKVKKPLVQSEINVLQLSA